MVGTGLFSTKDCQKLLKNKYVLIIGDSVSRSMYKDLIILHQQNRLITQSELRRKGEDSVANDSLVRRSELTNGVHFYEIREYKSDDILIRFYFVTRIYNDFMRTTVFGDLKDKTLPKPDVICIHSCMWDLTRYGPTSFTTYQKHLEKFCNELDEIVPPETHLVWRTALPTSQLARGGFLDSKHNNVRQMNPTTRLLEVLLANHVAHAVVAKHYYDVIDLHYMFFQQQRRQASDGVHWNRYAHRRMTNIFLSHLSKAWGFGLPSHPYLDESHFIDKRDLSANLTHVLETAYNNNTDKLRSRQDQNVTYSKQLYTTFYEEKNETIYYNETISSDESANDTVIELKSKVEKIVEPPSREKFFADAYLQHKKHLQQTPPPAPKLKEAAAPLKFFDVGTDIKKTILNEKCVIYQPYPDENNYPSGFGVYHDDQQSSHQYGSNSRKVVTRNHRRPDSVRQYQAVRNYNRQPSTTHHHSHHQQYYDDRVDHHHHRPTHHQHHRRQYQPYNYQSRYQYHHGNSHDDRHRRAYDASYRY